MTFSSLQFICDVMNELPIECLINILRNVEISIFEDGISKLGNLNRCGKCNFDNIDCKHLTEAEVVGIKFLKLVCTKWRDCICEHFVFVSGPRFVLPNVL